MHCTTLLSIATAAFLAMSAQAAPAPQPLYPTIKQEAASSQAAVPSAGFEKRYPQADPSAGLYRRQATGVDDYLAAATEALDKRYTQAAPTGSFEKREAQTAATGVFRRQEPTGILRRQDGVAEPTGVFRREHSPADFFKVPYVRRDDAPPAVPTYTMAS